jgi:hypothetical protein
MAARPTLFKTPSFSNFLCAYDISYWTSPFLFVTTVRSPWAIHSVRFDDKGNIQQQHLPLGKEEIASSYLSNGSCRISARYLGWHHPFPANEEFDLHTLRKDLSGQCV